MLHPPDCPTWFPLHSLADYVYGSPRRFARFISSCMIRGAPIYPRYRDLYPTRRDSDRCLLLADCLHSWIAQGVENVLHVTWLPNRCMTSSQLTRLQPNLLPRCCLTLLRFQLNDQRPTALKWVHHEQIRKPHITLHMRSPTPSTILCRQIMMNQPAITLGNANDHIFEVGFADLWV